MVDKVIDWFTTKFIPSLVATPFPTLLAFSILALAWMARKWVGAIEQSKTDLTATQEKRIEQAMKLAPLLEVIGPVLRDVTDTLERVEALVGRKGKQRNPLPLPPPVPEAKP
jgi:hypothetical protein